MLVARPIMPMGRDIGYLPGDKDEKLTAWMQPIFDNLTYLLSTRGSPNQHPDSRTPEQRVAKLMADGKLVLEPLTYIRGRSIPHQFMIVDEAQNLTPHEVRTIVSRVGEGTKIVLTGDIGQIDNPYLDSSIERAELHRRADEARRHRGARDAGEERAERAGEPRGGAAVNIRSAHVPASHGRKPAESTDQMSRGAWKLRAGRFLDDRTFVFVEKLRVSTAPT